MIGLVACFRGPTKVQERQFLNNKLVVLAGKTVGEKMLTASKQT
jgi:hypothetical protein